ncbi:MAG: GNAT family N-acetyltransferase [Gordonia sp.]|jgi:putative hemolysin|uniref:GNAT family N-acetyltransferase n=1 Tax=Gordonia rubripertincta TaxID=36822 RepID=A0ABT4MR63_GORRU|nr:MULTISPECIES: GNAT family N-acyltransferase [Mycobacteriales]MBA4024969.1 GNAT family N-acetyltransferase [Gordonia sp. (in: high G+C Gram-positive bacteria)]MCZ4549324.1 GNAT family N-acetyltransferase [Gordonia rubripertincta]OZG29030.1 ornithine-acyl-ACP acyltransferase [Williamsia sp. 1138]
MTITPLIPAATENGYSISLTTDPVDIEHAERLRYKLFADEMGATLPNAVRGEHTGEMIDIDQFDSHCDHMVARAESSGEVVGTFRLLPPHGAVAAGGYFTDTIFEFSEGFDAMRPNLVELGRAAVHSEHRSGAVMGLLWAGVLKYQELTGHEHAIGCASVRMEDGGPRGSLVRRVRDFAYGLNLSDPDLRMTPKNPVSVDGRGLDDIADPGRVKIPPMVQGCMRIGAAVCGPPSYDSDFDMADFVVLISRARLNHRYLQRMTEAALAR